MFFLKISNVDVEFGERTLTWRSYTTIEALPSIEQIQVVNPKEFNIAMLDADNETFVIHVAIWKLKKWL